MRIHGFAVCVLGFLAVACGRDGLGARRQPDGAAVAGTDSETGFVDSGAREADGGRALDTAGEKGGTDSGLTVAPWKLTCGNGVIDPGESCDDGNRRPGDGCEQDCCQEFNFMCCDNLGCWVSAHRPCHCGDGFVEPGEQCDDGNLIFGDGCNGYCEIETGRCGNGIVDPGEECDDGNLLFGAGQYGDGCDPSCRQERIGCFPPDAGI
jgi:large repetitive protein